MLPKSKCSKEFSGDGGALDFRLVNGLHPWRHSCCPEGVGGRRALVGRKHLLSLLQRRPILVFSDV